MGKIKRACPAGFLVLAFGMFFFCTHRPTPAAVYHVDAERGEDSRDGRTPTRAWQTLQHAADTVRPGDTVIVEPGSYGRTTITSSGKPEAPIVFRGRNAPKVTFPSDGAPVPTGRTIIAAVYDSTNARLENPRMTARSAGFEISGSHVRIENFEFTALGPDTRSAILLDRAADVAISGNYFHELCGGPKGFDYSGGVNGPGSDIVVKSNVFWRVEGVSVNVSGMNWRVEENDISHGTNLRWTDRTPVCGDTDAVRFFGSGHIIRRNYLHHYLRAENDGCPHTDFVQCFATRWEPETHYVLIENNTGYYNTGGQGIIIENMPYTEGKIDHITIRGNIMDTTTISYPVILQGIPWLTVVHNVFAHSSGWGLEIDKNSHHAVVLNNIFYGNKSGSGFDDDASCTDSVWDYNIHFPDYSWPKKRPEFDTHGLFGEDPRFVNPAARDYHLRPGSPAIARGTDAGLQQDHESATISRSSAPDIGAFKFQGDGSRGAKKPR